jgi:hypothetical protein
MNSATEDDAFSSLHVYVCGAALAGRVLPTFLTDQRVEHIIQIFFFSFETTFAKVH